MGAGLLVEDPDLHSLLVREERNVYGIGDMVLLIFERGADIDNEVGIEKCFAKFRGAGHWYSPEGSRCITQHQGAGTKTGKGKTCQQTQPDDLTG
jgi:hypothetical protein